MSTLGVCYFQVMGTNGCFQNWSKWDFEPGCGVDAIYAKGSGIALSYYVKGSTRFDVPPKYSRRSLRPGCLGVKSKSYITFQSHHLALSAKQACLTISHFLVFGRGIDHSVSNFVWGIQQIDSFLVFGSYCANPIATRGNLGRAHVFQHLLHLFGPT